MNGRGKESRAGRDAARVGDGRTGRQVEGWLVTGRRVDAQAEQLPDGY